MSTVITEPFVHPALFYQGTEGFLAGTVPFIVDGLAAGEPVAVAVPAHHLEPLRSELGAAAADVQLLDMNQVGRNPGRIIPGVLAAFADRYPKGRVRIIGEPIWPNRSEVEYPACAQHEALINLAFAGRTVTILCPYDVASLAPQVIDDAKMTHPVLIEGSLSRDSERYAPEDVVAAYNQRLSVPVTAKALIANSGNLAQLRSFVAERASLHGLSLDRVRDLQLAVNELATNSIEHAYDDATVLIWREDEYVVCEVRDQGHLTDPLVGRRRVSPEQLRGRGLFLVNQLADLVRVYTVPGTTAIQARFAVTG